MGPEYELISFRINFTTRKWRVWKWPRLNEDARGRLLKVRLGGQRLQRVAEEVHAPPAWRIALPCYVAA